MSKISLDRLTSQFGFQAAFNSVLQDIEDEFSNRVLYRDNPAGEPNSMNNDIDMAGNDLINVGLISASDFRVNGQGLSEAINSLVDQIDESIDEANAAVLAAEGFADEAEGWAHVSESVATNLSDPDGSSFVGFIQDETNSKPRTVEEKLREHVSVFDFMTPERIADVEARTCTLECWGPIQAAIDSGAMRIFVPNGTYKVSFPLTMSNNGQELYGVGGTYFFDWQDPSNGSIFKCMEPDSGTMIRIVPSVTNKPVYGVKIKGIILDGQYNAFNGIWLSCATKCTVREVGLTSFTGNALRLGGIPPLEGFTGLKRVHSCTFDDISIRQTTEAAGHGLHCFGEWDGTSDWRSTVCTFSNFSIMHQNGDGVRIAVSDTNYYLNFGLSRRKVFVEGVDTSTGVGIHLLNTPEGVPTANNAHIFFGLTHGPGGVVSGNEFAGGLTPKGNVIYGMLNDTGTVIPYIAPGSQLKFYIAASALDSNHNSSETPVKINMFSGANTTAGVSFTPDATGNYAIDCNAGTFSAGQLRLKSNGIGVVARKADNSGDFEMFRANTSNEMAIFCPLRLSADQHINTTTTTGSKICATAVQKLGFWGATPVVQPAANPDTSGATLGELETEVNQLKALLRSIGLMAS